MEQEKVVDKVAERIEETRRREVVLSSLRQTVLNLSASFG